jgi:hypothetical protein
VTLLSQSSPEKVRPSAGFHANQFDLQVRSEEQQHLTANAQQQSNSDQSNSVAADRANDADVQLMRRDLRPSMKQAAPAARITKNGGFLFATCESLGHLQIEGVI